jgi:hypothetical protein
VFGSLWYDMTQYDTMRCGAWRQGKDMNEKKERHVYIPDERMVGWDLFGNVYGAAEPDTYRTLL